MYIFILLIKLGGLFCFSLCLAICVHCPFFFQTLYVFIENQIQMSSIVLHVYFTVFCNGVVSCLSVFFIVILHAFCEGHRLEDAKSLKMLVTKGVLENTTLDNGRIEVHPMNPRETFENTRAVDGPLSLR